MTRREFSATLTGCAVAYPFARGKPCLFERRTYRGIEPGLANYLAALFPRAGIYPLIQRETGASLEYLIPFQDLSARHRAWADLNTDPAWIATRPRFASYHFTLYRDS